MWKLFCVGERRKGEGMKISCSAKERGESTLRFAWDNTCVPHHYGKQLPLAYKDLGLPLQRRLLSMTQCLILLGFLKSTHFCRLLMLFSDCCYLVLSRVQLCESDCPWSKWARMFCFCPWSVHGIHSARIQEWVAIPFSNGSSQPRNRTPVSTIAGRFFTVCTTREDY